MRLIEATKQFNARPEPDVLEMLLDTVQTVAPVV